MEAASANMIKFPRQNKGQEIEVLLYGTDYGNAAGCEIGADISR